MQKYRKPCPHCGFTGRMNLAPLGQGRQCPSCRRVISLAEEEPKRQKTSKRRTTRGRSSRQEKYNATRVGGRTTLNSGAMDDKGDIKVPGLLREEDKTTKRRSFSLKLDDLRKVEAAAKGDEIPVMAICFEDDLKQQYYVMRDSDFLELLRVYKEHLGHHLD